MPRKSVKWKTKGARKEGVWYWVTTGRQVWPAKYDPIACGGWTNEDTWEDYGGRIVAWIKADCPIAPKELRKP